MLEFIVIGILILLTVLALFRPDFGLYAFLIVAYIRPQDYYPFLVDIEPAKWILIITFVSFIFQRLSTQQGFVKAKQNWAILGILLAIFISRTNAIDPENWWNATQDFIVVYLAYFLIVNSITDRKKLRNFYLFFILINFIVAFRFHSAFTSGTAGTHGGKPGDTSLGFLGNADDLGIGMAIALAYAVLPIFFARSLLLKGLSGLISVTFMWAAMTTESRGAHIGVLTVYLTAIISQFKFRKFQVQRFSIGMLIALLVLAGFTYKYRYALQNSYETSQDEYDPGRMGRMYAWAAAREMIKESPIIGIGRGNFVAHWRENYPPGGAGYQVAHNIIYQVAAEIGFFGLAFFLFFSLIGLKELRGIHKRYQGKLKKDYFIDMLFAIYVAGVIGFLVNGMFITVAFYWHIYILVAMFVCAKNVFLKEALKKK